MLRMIFYAPMRLFFFRHMCGLRRSRRAGEGSWQRGGKKRYIDAARDSPGEERGNETEKIVIAHGVEFCEATLIGL